jgi:hypothetical protein
LWWFIGLGSVRKTKLTKCCFCVAIGSIWETLEDEVEVEVEVNLWRTVSRPVCLGVRRPSGTRDQFFFLLEISFRQLQLCYFVAPSLTRGRVCNLLVQWLLGLARAVTLESKSHRTHGHILLSHLRLPQPGGPGPRIYIPPGTGWPSYTPGHWVRNTRHTVRNILHGPYPMSSMGDTPPTLLIVHVDLVQHVAQAVEARTFIQNNSDMIPVRDRLSRCRGFLILSR